MSYGNMTVAFNSQIVLTNMINSSPTMKGSTKYLLRVNVYKYTHSMISEVSQTLPSSTPIEIQ